MTDRHAVTGVAGRRDVCGVVEVKRIQFILFPHLPVCREKVAQLVGSPVGHQGRLVNVIVTANRAVPTVGSELERSRQPELL